MNLNSNPDLIKQQRKPSMTMKLLQDGDNSDASSFSNETNNEININNKRYLDSSLKKSERSSTPNEPSSSSSPSIQNNGHHQPFTLPSSYGIHNIKQEASQSPSPKRQLVSPRESPNPQQQRVTTPGGGNSGESWNMLGGIIMKSLVEELPPAIVIPANSNNSITSNSPTYKPHRKMHHHAQQQQQQQQQQSMSQNPHQFMVSPQHLSQSNMISEKDIFNLSHNSSLIQQQQALAALVNA